jgi:uncharacterized membrane protein YgcG
MLLETIIKYRFMPEFEHGQFVRAFEKRVCVDRLIDLIEKYENEAQAEMKEKRDKRKAKKAESKSDIDDKSTSEK